MKKKITMSSHSNYEIVCKDIHDSWGEPNHLVQVLTSRTQIECRNIREKYREMYGKDLFLDLKNSSQRNDSRSAGLSMLLMNPRERDADAAKEALDQESGMNYKALIEVFAGRKSSHFLLILQAYHTKFRRHLDQDIISIEPSTPYKKILMALTASHKSHHAEVSQYIAKCDAQRLYQTGEGRTGSIDEAVVLEMLSKRCIPQLKLTFSSYKRIYGHDYTKSLKNENYGGFEDALKEVVRYICNPPKHYAKTLYASIKGTSMDKRALARVMVSRAEVDMDEIQGVFKRKYGMKLSDAISESTLAGDHKDFLVALAMKIDTAA